MRVVKVDSTLRLEEGRSEASLGGNLIGDQEILIWNIGIYFSTFQNPLSYFIDTTEN